MYEDGRDVNAIGTRHTILTVVAWDILKSYDLVGYFIIQIPHLVIRQGHQRTIRQKVVLQVLHISHTTQNGKHAFRGSCITESPRCHRPLWRMTLQLCHQILR